MIVEVISVGTELLIGEIINSNTAAIGSRLAADGFDAHYQVTVGDNLDRLTKTIEQALDRADAVVMTGGIGPTQDDLTREAIAKVAGVEMTRDEQHAEWIGQRVRSQGRAMASNVLRMAEIPDGAEGLPNAKGVALGVAMEIQGKWVFAVPGVPSEMKVMMDHEVLPRLRTLDEQPAVLKSRLLHTWGFGESTIAEMLADLYETTNPSVAFLIREMEVRVRISAKARDEQAAMELIEPVEREVRARLGEAVFASDAETVEQIVVGQLRELGWTIATTESATLGRIGSSLAAAAGGLPYAGTLIRGSSAADSPKADVHLDVGEIGDDTSEGPRTTRPVRFVVTTPTTENERVFDFGGDDERVRAFAAGAGIHLVRTTLDDELR